MVLGFGIFGWILGFRVCSLGLGVRRCEIPEHLGDAILNGLTFIKYSGQILPWCPGPLARILFKDC